MIKVNMETKDGVILNTNGKYCEDYIQVTSTNVDAISAQNIKKGVTILGIEGVLEPSNIDQLISGEITTFNIPNSVINIGQHAFSNCSQLVSITIPNNVTSIGDSAFSYCSSLTDVTIPNSVTTIGSNAFYGCSSLTSITIPNSVTSIGRGAFSSCRSLVSVTIEHGVTSISWTTFGNCSSLTDVTIPNSVTSIGWNTFDGCTSLTDVTIENGFNADDLDLSASTKYTHDTILSWLNALYDRSSLSAYTLTIGTDNLNKLTDEEKAIATNKNWTLA